MDVEVNRGHMSNWKAIARYMGAGDETDTPRDGLLSARSEWHALAIGLAVGGAHGTIGSEYTAYMVVAVLAAALELEIIEEFFLDGIPDEHPLADLRAQPWYAAGGLVLGYTVTIIL